MIRLDCSIGLVPRVLVSPQPNTVMFLLRLLPLGPLLFPLSDDWFLSNLPVV